MPFSFEKLMSNEIMPDNYEDMTDAQKESHDLDTLQAIEESGEDEIINEDAEVIVEETQPLIEQPVIEDNGEACFAVKKIFLNGKHYFKDDMLDSDVAKSDIAFLLNRGLIVLHN
jgi:hemolysin activation/secretion protein